MVGGVTGAAGYQYFLQMKQAQGAKTRASRIFNNSATNGNGSVSKGEFSAFQSALVGRPQDTQLSSQTGPTEFLINLLQSAGHIGSTNTATGTTASPTSQQCTVDDIFNEMDANGDGSISKEEMPASQSTTAAALQSGAVGSTGNSTSTQTAGATGLTSFVQQAISKYLQLTPGGLIGAAGLGGFLATA
jgi:hypothetical protein